MKKISLVIVCCMLWACDSNKRPSEEAYLASIDTTANENEPVISEEVIGDIIQQVPSPLEISVLIKESGNNYNNKFLNPAENSSQYSSNFKQALNLGIYGTDLGYTNIYEQNQDALFYLSSIRDLAEDLSIGQFFDFNTISRLATNSKNLDSLLLITTQNFNNINSYLQNQERENLSVLILTGGWLEALHISNQVLAMNPNSKDLQVRIGEQKIILENIMLLLSFYEGKDPHITDLIKDMKRLQKEFDKVNISYTYAESTFEEVNGVLMIKDNSTSKVTVTDQILDSINKVTKSIRKKIIS